MTPSTARTTSWSLASATALALASAAAAQTPPDYDFQWSTITHAGNPGYQGPDINGQTRGRGSVGYHYRISRLEVTSGQWMEFANAMWALGDPYRIGEDPVAGYEQNFGGGGPNHWVLRNLPQAERLPVVGITWYNAARYCNWLHNGKQNTLESLVTGAYDTTTFGPTMNGQRPDALTHLPGAKYWIPTFDEWLKAVHYDPDRYGDGQGGYWMYPNGTDTPLIRGTVESGGQTNANSPSIPVSSVWLGAYTNVQTPWGLFDASGGAAEWCEDATDFTRTFRRYDGSAYIVEMSNPPNMIDLVYRTGGTPPDSSGFAAVGAGLRIASSIPSPSGVIGLSLLGFSLTFRRRKRHDDN